MADDALANTRGKLIYEDLTQQVIGAAIEVHKTIGPGLLESVYQECMCRELNLRGLHFQREVKVPVIYKGVALDCGYRLDLIVEDTVILELKCVDRVVPNSRSSIAHLLEVVGQACRIHYQFQRAHAAGRRNYQESI